MKTNKKRLIALVSAAVLVAACLIFMIFFNGHFVYISTGLNSNTILKVDGISMTKAEAKILMSDARSQYEELLGEDIWNETIDGESFYSYVNDQIKVKLIRVAMLNKLAKERGVVLSRDEENNVEAAAAEYYNNLSDDDKKQLDVSLEDLEEMYTKFVIANKLYEDIISEYDIEVSYDDARVIDIQYIVSDSKEEVENAYNSIQSGSSFFAIAKEINDDGNYEMELKKGEMDQTFEDIAFNLSTGDMSEVFEVNGLYYLIRCTSDNDKTKTEVNKTTILESKQLEQFNEYMNEYESKYYVDFNTGVWAKLSVRSNSIYSSNFESIFNSYLYN